MAAPVNKKIKDIETLIQNDIGNRGIGKITLTGEVEGAAKVLLESKNILIVTGFFIFQCGHPETDGPLGAVAITRSDKALNSAKALKALGKNVQLMTDTRNQEVLQKCVNESGIKMDPVIVFPMENEQPFIDTLLNMDGRHHHQKIDCLVSIERLGAASDGNYYNMRGMNISEYTAKIDKLFLTAQLYPEFGIKTIGIGDGGNEIGMGKVHEAVKLFIPHGDKIGTVVATDYLITCGVSNWGGYGLAGAMAVLYKEQHQDTPNDKLAALLPSSDKETHMLEAIVKAGAVDGCKQKNEVSVDGLELDVHLKIIERIRAIVLDQQ